MDIKEAQGGNYKYDGKLISSDGIPFNIHKDIIAADSRFLESVFQAEQEKQPDNGVTSYRLENIESETLSIVISYIYRNDYSIPFDLLLPVLLANDSLALRSKHLREKCLILIGLAPLPTVLEHKLFKSMILEDHPLVLEILDLNLTLEESDHLKDIIISWSSKSIRRQRDFMKVAVAHLETAYIFDRSSKKLYSFKSINLCESHKSLNFPAGMQQMHVLPHSEDEVWYADSNTLKTIHGDKLPKSKHKKCWPPLLRRFGHSIFWTADRQVLVCGNGRKNPTKEISIKKTGRWIRAIAASDVKSYENVVLLITEDGTWDIAEVSFKPSCKLLNCPFQQIDGVAVLDGVIYAVGNIILGEWSCQFVAYQDGEWESMPQRIRNDTPKAFFPLNGRLYVLCNFVHNCEVYDPLIKKWILIDFPLFADIGSFCSSRWPSDNCWSHKSYWLSHDCMSDWKINRRVKNCVERLP